MNAEAEAILHAEYRAAFEERFGKYVPTWEARPMKPLRPSQWKPLSRPHLYAGDGAPDFQGFDRCVHCGLGKVHYLHKLEPAPREAIEHDQAVLGERESR